jgi:integrase
MGKLTALKVKTAGPGKHEDGDGLRLVVSNSGGRKWVLRYQISGRRREMGLGAFPELSLAQAREAASGVRNLVRKKIDPIEHQRQEIDRRRQAELGVPTFTSVAAQYIRAHRRSWQNAKHQRQWVATLKTYARPVIGEKPVDAITTEDVLRILQPIWIGKTETAKRVQGRVENILDFAAARKWREPTNPARWRGHLSTLLASPAKLKRHRNGGEAKHHPALPFADVPAFVRELRRVDGVSARALEFLIYTTTRTSEVLGGRWSEVDLESATWTIPASRMKAKREHRVPLSPGALAVLGRVPRVEASDYVFPGARKGRPLSNMSLLEVMRGLGYGVGGDRGAAVPHGFRSSFRDWAGEVSSYPTNVAEAALAHVLGDKTEAAYARGTLFDKRRRMMEDWGRWCDGASNAAVLGKKQKMNEANP